VNVTIRIRFEQTRFESQKEDKYLSSPSPDRLDVHPKFCFTGYLELFPLGLNGRGVELNTHFHLLPKLRGCDY
jgi:hypothetical protein